MSVRNNVLPQKRTRNLYRSSDIMDRPYRYTCITLICETIDYRIDSSIIVYSTINGETKQSVHQIKIIVTNF